MNYVYFHKLKNSVIMLINDSSFSIFFDKYDEATAIIPKIPRNDLFITKQLSVCLICICFCATFEMLEVVIFLRLDLLYCFHLSYSIAFSSKGAHTSCNTLSL